MTEAERIKRLEQAVSRIALVVADHRQNNGDRKLARMLREMAGQLDPACLKKIDKEVPS